MRKNNKMYNSQPNIIPWFGANVLIQHISCQAPNHLHQKLTQTYPTVAPPVVRVSSRFHLPIKDQVVKTGSQITNAQTSLPSDTSYSFSTNSSKCSQARQ